MSNAKKVRRYLTKYPNAKAAEVADRFGVTTAYVYALRSQMKRDKNNEELESIGDKVQGLLNKPAPANKVMPPPATDVDATLSERGKRYGTFTGHAEVTYKLKNILRVHAEKVHKTFSYDQAEAMDMICHKLGRIVNGDPDYADSWIDIAGYAKLVADRLEGKEV